MACQQRIERRKSSKFVIGAVAACGYWGLQNFGFVHPRLQTARSIATELQAGAASAPSGEFSFRYFNGRGPGETARMIFAVAGESFDDARYPLDFGANNDLSTVSRPEFDADRAAGKMEVSMGKIPILDAGEFSLPQSKAIERYLARRFGMMGETPEEDAWVDAVGEHLLDINNVFGSKGLMFMKDLEKKAEIEKKWFEEEFPPLVQKLEKTLPGAEGFAVGSKTSLADIKIYQLFKDTFDKDVSAIYADCPKLKAITERMSSNEALAKWVAERPKGMF